MAHKTNLYAIMLCISTGTLALANNAIALEGDKTNAEEGSTTFSASEKQDDAALQVASSSKFAGPKNVPDSSGDDVKWKKKEIPFKPYAVTLNALNLSILRASVNFEILPAVHHGIIVNPSIWHWTQGSSNLSLTAVGIELGYRFYSGTKGANGFFMGPSFLYNYKVRTEDEIYYHADSTRYGEDTTTYHMVGCAIDVGGQYVSDSGLTIGGGVGIAYFKTKRTFSNKDSDTSNSASPRFLFMIGYSF